MVGQTLWIKVNFIFWHLICVHVCQELLPLHLSLMEIQVDGLREHRRVVCLLIFNVYAVHDLLWWLPVILSRRPRSIFTVRNNRFRLGCKVAQRHMKHLFIGGTFKFSFHWAHRAFVNNWLVNTIFILGASCADDTLFFLWDYWLQLNFLWDHFCIDSSGSHWLETLRGLLGQLGRMGAILIWKQLSSCWLFLLLRLDWHIFLQLGSFSLHSCWLLVLIWEDVVFWPEFNTCAFLSHALDPWF